MMFRAVRSLVVVVSSPMKVPWLLESVLLPQLDTPVPPQLSAPLPFCVFFPLPQLGDAFLPQFCDEVSPARPSALASLPHLAVCVPLQLSAIALLPPKIGQR